MLEERVRERTAELRSTQLDVVHRLGQAAEARDGETGLHIQRIGHLSRALGIAHGMSVTEADLLQQASAMHDVGKIGIPDRILLKPGRLEQSERTLMQTHTTIGAGILSGSTSPLLQMAEEIALTHHERFDGSGYPNGLRGEEIPVPGRICAIVDVFDALMSARTYKDAWTLDAALDELRDGRGTHFDPELLDEFIELAPSLLRDLTDRGLVAYAPADEHAGEGRGQGDRPELDVPAVEVALRAALPARQLAPALDVGAAHDRDELQAQRRPAGRRRRVAERDVVAAHERDVRRPRRSAPRGRRCPRRP